jgi:GNAT superfamily N-acetyltransferase
VLRLRHLDIQPFEDVASLDRFQDLVGHLALEGEVADLLYNRFGTLCVAPGFLAMQKERPVGICGWRQDEGLAFLGPLAVCPEKRSWGLGGALVDRVLEEVRSEGVRSIESVYPSADPASRKLFFGRGFRVLGQEHGKDRAVWTRVERQLKKS